MNDPEADLDPDMSDFRAALAVCVLGYALPYSRLALELRIQASQIPRYLSGAQRPRPAVEHRVRSAAAELLGPAQLQVQEDRAARLRKQRERAAILREAASPRPSIFVADSPAREYLLKVNRSLSSRLPRSANPPGFPFSYAHVMDWGKPEERYSFEYARRPCGFDSDELDPRRFTRAQ